MEGESKGQGEESVTEPPEELLGGGARAHEWEGLRELGETTTVRTVKKEPLAGVGSVYEKKPG